MLQVEDLNVYYGAIHALQGISFHVDEGEIVTLIGANGAGKSTTLRTISGLLQAAHGHGAVQGGGHHHHARRADRAAGHQPGARGPQDLRAADGAREPDDGRLHPRPTPRRSRPRSSGCSSSFPRLKERIGQLGGTLSGGEQQMLATGRGLMSRPSLLLLDEPSMGLSPILVEEIFRIIVEINKQGTSILLVEQNAQMALSVAHRAYVLETGRIVLEGSAREIAENPQVKSGVPRDRASPRPGRSAPSGGSRPTFSCCLRREPTNRWKSLMFFTWIRSGWISMRRWAMKWFSTSRHCPVGMPAQWAMSSTVVFRSIASPELVSTAWFSAIIRNTSATFASTSCRVRIMNLRFWS